MVTGTTSAVGSTVKGELRDLDCRADRIQAISEHIEELICGTSRHGERAPAPEYPVESLVDTIRKTDAKFDVAEGSLNRIIDALGFDERPTVV